jgi:hypothetical protein
VAQADVQDETNGAAQVGENKGKQHVRHLLAQLATM